MSRLQRWEGLLFGEMGYSNTQQSKGGLGIRNLRLQNNSLLMKWLWRYNEEDIAIQKEVTVAKFGELNPWCTEIVTEPFGVGVWRKIRALRPPMEANLKFEVVGNGDKIKFWKGRWIDHIPLMESFSDLFFNL